MDLNRNTLFAKTVCAEALEHTAEYSKAYWEKFFLTTYKILMVFAIVSGQCTEIESFCLANRLNSVTMNFIWKHDTVNNNILQPNLSPPSPNHTSSSQDQLNEINIYLMCCRKSNDFQFRNIGPINNDPIIKCCVCLLPVHDKNNVWIIHTPYYLQNR